MSLPRTACFGTRIILNCRYQGPKDSRRAFGPGRDHRRSLQRVWLAKGRWAGPVRLNCSPRPTVSAWYDQHLFTKRLLFSPSCVLEAPAHRPLLLSSGWHITLNRLTVVEPLAFTPGVFLPRVVLRSFN